MSGIVLAGGRSVRFGRDKLLEPVRGTPLLHHAVRGLGAVCAEVVVVVAPDAPDPDVPGDVPVMVARDLVADGGPLVGLAAGLALVRTDRALVAGGDMPDLREPVLLAMLRVADDPVEGVVLHDGEVLRPLPCVVSVPRAREVARARLAEGERSLHAFLSGLRLAIVEASIWRALDPAGGTLRDIDEPADLED